MSNLLPLAARRPGSEALVPAIAGAVVSAFFSFGGWWEASKIAGEIRNPRRTLPLAFLGGSFYSINMLPPLCQKIALFNPVVYLISSFRWSFYGISDVSVVASTGMTLVFLIMCVTAVWWIFKTGYRFKA